MHFRKLVFISFIFFSSISEANYEDAINHYNKEQFTQSIIEFKRVALKKSSENPKKKDAMYNLGVIYDNGLGVSVNKSEAVNWYKLAADNNHKIAQFNLAWMYFNGDHLEKDFFQAFKYYELSAKQGYNKAQFNLASLYYSGDGTLKDYVSAYKWFKISSVNGISESKKFLALIKPSMHPEEITEADKFVKDWLKAHNAKSK